MFDSILSVTLLVLGFGFVIFWHELGHFLAAKWVGIKVEQFAVGFGQALLAWRKGVGVRVGTTRPEYERRIREHLDAAEKNGTSLKNANNPSTAEIDAATSALGLGETEYRLNWIPLGGYVKMLGQDDMNPNSISDDPRAYPQKSVGARMLVISAGVIMNIILAAMLFMLLYTIGHRVSPAIVGGILPGSPAQRVTQVVDGKTIVTSLQVGDQLLELDGTKQADWTKVSLTTALADPDEPTTVKVRHVDGTEATYSIAPQKQQIGPSAARGFLELGIEQPRSLRGPDPKKVKSKDDDAETRERVPADYFAIRPGDAIVGIDGQAVNPEDPKNSAPNDYYKLDRAVQAAGLASGRPVELQILRADGKADSVKVQPRFVRPMFGKDSLNFAGMLMRTTVVSLGEKSAAKGILKPGDVIAGITVANDSTENPTFDDFTMMLDRAGHATEPVKLAVLRDGARVDVTVNATYKVGDDKFGLGFDPGYDAANPVVAGIAKDSPAERAGIPSGATIASINGTAVKNWYDIHRVVAAAPIAQPFDVIGTTKDGKPLKVQMTLTEPSRDGARSARYAIGAVQGLDEQVMLRKAANPLQAAAWGVTETRDFILQFYVTIRRMFDGSVSPKNLMGPVGIFTAGTTFAFKGTDWLIWFLAMISANLAVVNFLPIPVVDGGHFVFLCLEKIQGKPVSQRAQSIAQVVGLALLLGVFLLVTYQDIARMIRPF
jgi:regulator of sigma E protease